ncbi:MAG TPA: prephenate dehydratase [Nitrospiraceae bacterium]|nr:prephenate dehydratase [Nitrospiraceae bacterium]
MSTPDLQKLREKIDKIDDTLVDLLNERARIVVEVGNIKKNEKLEFHSPSREREIIGRLTKRNTGPFPEDTLKAVYREILTSSLSLERPLKVAYLGPRATFTHMAGMQQFGLAAQYVPVESIKDIFSEVERGRADYGVVPIENSTEGVVNYTLDTFIDSDLKISAEVMLEVSQTLMNKTGRIEDIKKIYTHPQVPGQCRQWLEKNVPTVPIADAPSTSRAAEMAADDPAVAAIASETAALLNGLQTVAKSIQDSTNNYTRFLVIAPKSPGRTGRDKTSIMFSIKDRVGALYAMLEPFAQLGVNLTRLDARPSGKKVWDYVFFLDMEGHTEDKKVAEAIESLKKDCLFLKVLGSYPKSS